jgi:hypothetical protein
MLLKGEWALMQHRLPQLLLMRLAIKCHRVNGET